MVTVKRHRNENLKPEVHFNGGGYSTPNPIKKSGSISGAIYNNDNQQRLCCVGRSGMLSPNLGQSDN